MTWPFQEQAILRLNAAIGKHDILIEKSRDMGATWMIIALFVWRWIFFPGQSFLLGSRKEEYVDGDARSLLWKADYLLDHLPQWMVPEYNRIAKHLTNLENGSTIDGEATNENFGRGDRRAGVLLDEFAAVDGGHSVVASTRDTTNCRIFLSTPQGTAGAYYEQRQKMAAENPERVIRLHWSLHPHKSVGLYERDGKVRSPWYDEQCRRAASQHEIAQELDIGYEESGWQFFDAPILKALVAEMCRDPQHTGELDFDFTDLRGKFVPMSDGHLSLWCPLVKGRPPGGAYVIGCDVATGKGGDQSSQSAASIVSLTTGEKVGEYAYNAISPQNFARYCAALCKWFHDATLIWEENGPGNEFGQAIVRDIRYRKIFYRKDEKSISSKRTMKPGWFSMPDAKRMLLGAYKEAIMQRKFINRSKPALSECAQFVHEPNGRIAHCRALAAHDPLVSGENHGDMVIADALANRLLGEVQNTPASQANDTPMGSMQWRFEQRLKEAKQTGNYWLGG